MRFKISEMRIYLSDLVLVLLLQYRVVRNEMEDGYKKRTFISSCLLFNRKES